MGKALIIKNANFQANALGQIETSTTGDFVGVQSSINLTASQNKIGRFMDYNASTSTKRVMLLDNNSGLLYVPSGGTVKISGLSGLCLDFACFDRDHNYMEWRMTASHMGYQDGVYLDFDDYTEGTLVYTYLVTTGYKENGNRAYMVTDGSVDEFTMTNNYDGEWFIFCIKRDDDTTVHPADVSLSYEVITE